MYKCEWICIGYRVCLCVQLHLTLCNPMDYSLTGSSQHGIFPARILEWIAISSSKGSSQPRDPTCISCIGRQILLAEPPGKDTFSLFLIKWIIVVNISCLFPLIFVPAQGACIDDLKFENLMLSGGSFTCNMFFFF